MDGRTPVVVFRIVDAPTHYHQSEDRGWRLVSLVAMALTKNPCDQSINWPPGERSLLLKSKSGTECIGGRGGMIDETGGVYRVFIHTGIVRSAVAQGPVISHVHREQN